MTNKQINEMIRFFRIATISDLSEVAHGIVVTNGVGAAKLQFDQMIQLVDLPRINVLRDCDVTFVSVPENHAIPIIKMLREFLDCGLREAKEMYDVRKCHVPAKVASDLIPKLRQMGVELKITQA